MIANLLWLFPQYRAAMDRIRELETLNEMLSKQLSEGTSMGFSTMLRDFQDQILQDQPFPGGQIPDEVWLTPGENDRAERGA